MALTFRFDSGCEYRSIARHNVPVPVTVALSYFVSLCSLVSWPVLAMV